MNSCSGYSNCTSWNAITTWKWSGSSWTEVDADSKTLSDYQVWEDPDLSQKYWYNYDLSTSIGLSSKIVTLQHQPFEGNIIPGVCCEWEFFFDPKSVYRVSILRPNEDNQFFHIYLKGRGSQAITVKNDNITRENSSFSVFRAVGATFSAIQTQSGVSSSYQ